MNVVIVFEPEEHAEGKWIIPKDTLSQVEEIELADGWVHVIRNGSVGRREKHRSYPASKVAMIDWEHRA